MLHICKSRGRSTIVSISVTYVSPVTKLEDELNDALGELSALEDDLNSTQDDLDAAEEELANIGDDLEGVKSQNLALMAVLVTLAILTVVMSVMFLSLRRKIAGMDVKSTEEEPPPPQS